MLEKILSKIKAKHNSESVKLISYHIPKTAGTSFRLMLEKHLGKGQVYNVYDKEKAKQFSKGDVSNEHIFANVIHGHFKPHPEHKTIYPNASSIVWIRDPIERIWSLVGHLMNEGEKHPHYQRIQELYVEEGITSQNYIVQDIIQNKTIPYMLETYRRYFSHLPIEDITFVGSVHHFEREITRLNTLFGLQLQPVKKNIRNYKDIPRSLKSLRTYLLEEYEIVDRYL